LFSNHCNSANRNSPLEYHLSQSDSLAFPYQTLLRSQQKVNPSGHTKGEAKTEPLQNLSSNANVF